MKDETAARAVAEDELIAIGCAAIERSVVEWWGADRAAELDERVGDLARAIMVVERSAGDTIRTDFFRQHHD